MDDIKKTVEQKLPKEMSASELAWEMFKRSGNVNYYRLYSDLKKKDE